MTEFVERIEFANAMEYIQNREHTIFGNVLRQFFDNMFLLLNLGTQL